MFDDGLLDSAVSAAAATALCSCATEVSVAAAACSAVALIVAAATVGTGVTDGPGADPFSLQRYNEQVSPCQHAVLRLFVFGSARATVLPGRRSPFPPSRVGPTPGRGCGGLEGGKGANVPEDRSQRVVHHASEGDPRRKKKDEKQALTS